MEKLWKNISDTMIEVEFGGILITMGRPPELPGIREIIENFDGPDYNWGYLVRDLLILWYFIDEKSSWYSSHPPTPFEEWYDYYSLKRRYPEAAACMWEHIRERWNKEKIEREARIPDAVKKMRNIKYISVDDLESLHSIHNNEFFDDPPWVINEILGIQDPDTKYYIDPELKTLWFIIKHIGPKRRIKATMDEESVDFLIYKRLRKEYVSEHKKMVEYLKEHQKIIQDCNSVEETV